MTRDSQGKSRSGPAWYYLLLMLLIFFCSCPGLSSPSLNITENATGVPILQVDPSEGSVLRINGPGGTYRYEEPTTAPILFPTAEEGEYQVTLLDATGLVIADESTKLESAPVASAEANGPILLRSMSSCGSVTEDTNVTADVAINGATCFTFTVPGVYLDCQNHRITGNGTTETYGIYANGFDDIIIRNCEIIDFDTGIGIIGNSRGDNVTNNTVRDSSSVGLHLDSPSARNNEISNNIVCGSGSSDIEGGSGNAWIDNLCDTAVGGATCASPCADVEILSTGLAFGNASMIEGYSTSVHATITNTGYRSITERIIIQFFLDTAAPENQIGENTTIASLNYSDSVVVNQSFTLGLGEQTIIVRIDASDNLSEFSETNNNASINTSVPLYQFFRGDFYKRVVSDDALNNTFMLFANETLYSGHVLIADIDSQFDITDLHALCRRTTGTAASTDFSDVDTNMNSTSFNDSIKNVWGGGTETPIETRTVNISGTIIPLVPFANHTVAGNHSTGILWDSADDASENNEYDTTDDEDLVFLTTLPDLQSPKKQYEIKVPCLLRQLKGTRELLAIYYEVD